MPIYRVRWEETQEAFVDAESRDEAIDKALATSDSQYKTVQSVKQMEEQNNADIHS